VLLFVSLVLRTAWLCDDAYITYRTIDNFLNGFGLTWNVAERVQTYTHPLWMMLHLGFIGLTRDFYFTPLLLSLVFGTGAVLLIALQITANRVMAALAVLVLALSKAVVEYTTSGLENPLSHFLVVIVFLLTVRNRPSERIFTWSCFTAALLLLNRQDLALMVAPMLGWQLYRLRSWRAALKGMLAFAPLASWMVFSTIYYGFPLPNTAYSKLGSGYPRGEVMMQGLIYHLHLLNTDPLTSLTLAGAVVAAVVSRRGPVLAAALGLVLYGLYIIHIGGDFMAGRFFSTPMVLAVAMLLVVMRKSGPLFMGSAAGVALLLALTQPNNPVWTTGEYGVDQMDIEKIVNSETSKVADERVVYYRDTGLLRYHRSRIPGQFSPFAQMALEARDKGRRFVSEPNIGLYGFFAGPGVHVIDTLGLGDPLLARMPAALRDDWRPGHYLRAIPNGYRETIERGGVNYIRDKELARYYDKLFLVTRGRLWDAERWVAIWELNTGQLDHLLQQARLSNYAGELPEWPSRLVPYAMVARSVPVGAPWNSKGAVLMGPRGIDIQLPETRRDREWVLLVDGDDDYRFVFLREGREVGRMDSLRRKSPTTGMQERRVPVPLTAREQGYDTIGVRPLRGDYRYSVAGLRAAR
jgi:arabinofuranosyltransferase